VTKLISTLVLFAAFAGQSQAATATPAAATVVKPTSVKPVVHLVPDAQIERTIRAKFAKSKINAEHFTVTVQNGVAIIEGKTGVIQHKGTATRLAKTGGALAVQNHIQISEEARAKAAAKLSANRGNTQLAQAQVIRPAK
jgi:osmotically-inducible protein OsmY